MNNSGVSGLYINMLNPILLFILVAALTAGLLYRFRWWLTVLAGLVVPTIVIYYVTALRETPANTDAPLYGVLYVIYVPAFLCLCWLMRGVIFAAFKLRHKWLQRDNTQG